MCTQQSAIGLIGKGKVSIGLAVLLTSHGYPTFVQDPCENFQAQFTAYYQDLVEQGLLSSEDAARCATYLQLNKALAECGIVFECGSTLQEKEFALKHVCADVQVIISLTTTLLPDEIVSVFPAGKDKLIVARMATAAHLVPLAELMPTKNCDALAQAQALLADLERKVVLLKKPVRGFLAARIYYALCREVLFLTENGYGDARDVDTATMYSILPRYTAIGPFEGVDNASIDLTVTTTGHLFPLFVNSQKAPQILEEAVASNRLGVKSGAGIYTYDEAAKQDLKRRIYAPWFKFFSAKVPATPYLG